MIVMKNVVPGSILVCIFSCVHETSASQLKGIYTPAGIAYIFKFGLTWSLHLLYDTGYHIDSVNTCYD